MTQAGNLRNHAANFTTELMTTCAVELGKILGLRSPMGSDTPHPALAAQRDQSLACRETRPVKGQALAWLASQALFPPIVISVGGIEGGDG